jgi:hypothetical protein
MRRILLLAGVALLVWKLRRRRGATRTERVVVGYDDGSSLALEPGARERERLLEIARDALAR